MTEQMQLGPIDFVLLEFPDADNPSGDAAARMRELVEQGTISIYDVVAIRRDSDGTWETFDLGEVSAEQASGFQYFAGARSGLLSKDDVDELANALNPGTVGIALVYENTWAQPFVTAARASGGAMIATGRVAGQDLIEALDTDD
ncbi:MAG: DUF6325 family protein [Candidatus Nanopelagicales bacterium]